MHTQTSQRGIRRSRANTTKQKNTKTHVNTPCNQFQTNTQSEDAKDSRTKTLNHHKKKETNHQNRGLSRLVGIDTLGGEWAATHTWHRHYPRSTTIGRYGVVYGLPVWRRPFPVITFFPFIFLFMHNLSGRKWPWGGYLLGFYVERRLHIILLVRSPVG